jgi:cellulose synthase/poly-beta-1,6-N-acetylglucosamine synthase-like glycosyltransferase
MKSFLVGEELVVNNVISRLQLEEALAQQNKTGVQLGQILLALGYLQHHQLDKILAEKFELKFEEISKQVGFYVFFDKQKIHDYIKHCYLPKDKNKLFISEPTPEKIQYLKNSYPDHQLIVSPKNQIMYFLHLFSKNELSHDSVYALAETYPDYSAAKVFIGKQLFFIYTSLSILLFLMFHSPIQLFLGINIFFTFFLVSSFLFKFYLTWHGSDPTHDDKISDENISQLDEKDLPIYSIIVPMYKEPEVLPHITKSLLCLDYPLEKLDIKLVLEEDDKETIEKAKALNLPDIFETIIVPHSLPKTKPKACNYALFFTRGEYITIYDAEDKPEPDQLKKAIACFKKSPANTAVVQARLNYFNIDENWLTKMFTMEYSLWFDFFLPALEKIKVPIPLGGTSNHFKSSILKSAGGWDPFNVTEDADLGIRFYQRGYKVEVLNSTTYEEANTDIGNWIRQRSRWLKGYMQTYLVHMRNPLFLYKTIGAKGFFAFQFFIGGTFFTALIAPWLYLFYFFWFFTRHAYLSEIFTPLLLYISIINLIFGNAFFIYIHMIGLFKRRYFNLIPTAIATPFYWILLSVSAYKGLYQLFFNPFYWEKTRHGLSKYFKKI